MFVKELIEIVHGKAKLRGSSSRLHLKEVTWPNLLQSSSSYLDFSLLIFIMSDQAERNLEEGSKPELSKDYHKDEPNSSVGIIGLLKISPVILLICGLIIWFLALGWIMIPLYLLVAIIVIVPLIANAFKQKGYLLVNVIAITVDPLFYYYVVLNKDGETIHFDEALGITVTVIRSFLDFLKLVYIIYELCHAYNELPNKGGRITIPCVQGELFWNLIQGKGGREFLENEAVRFWMLCLIDIPAIIPIPQGLVISGSKNVWKTMTCFLLQYLVRAIRTCFLYTQATGDSGILADATWAIVGFYILLYMQASHVFGALWYYYAIDTAYAGGGSVNGLYKEAIDSGIVKETDFPKKLLRCLSWGLQNLSGFGQNLKTSNNVWENIYAICMTNVGVVLFVFLIGKMQSDTRKSIRIKEKWRQLTQWPLFKDITDNVKGQIRKDNSNNWQNKRVKIDRLVSDLPQSTAREVKLQFGLNLLKKVKEFEKLSERSLKNLCDCMKPVVFAERTRIIREGDPIDEIVFVLEGKIWAYTNASINDSTLITKGQNLLKGGDLFGEELVAWAAPQNEISSSSNPLPVSARTYQAYTNVEAFTILALDLRRVSLLRRFERVVVLLQDRWRFIRYLREKRKEEKRSGHIRSFLQSCSVGHWNGLH